MPIEALLIDADGVLQYAPEPWSAGFARAMPFASLEEAHRFTSEVSAAETAHLACAEGFDEALEGVLRRWDCRAHRSSVLGTMLNILTHDEVHGLVKAIRAGGTRCFIASNQQAGRAEFMSSGLGYASLFDGELYSCHLGAAKPVGLYFERALEAIGVAAGSALFIDDRPENVEGARQAGLQAFVYDGRSGVAVLEARLREFGVVAGARRA